MEQAFLNDKFLKPDDEMIFSITDCTELLWQQTFSYLFASSKDISAEWKYSDCGKYWVCIALKRKNPLFRIHILKKNSFSISFPLISRSRLFCKADCPIALKMNLQMPNDLIKLDTFQLKWKIPMILRT